MTITKDNIIHAAGSVDGATGNRVSGGQTVSPARTAPGVYELTLEDPLDATEGACHITLRGVGPTNSYSMEWTSDEKITVKTFAAGLAADIGFDYTILNLVGV